jgi:glutathione S-transferase
MYRLHYAPDNASLIVRLALEELGVTYETVLVDRARQEQKSAGFRALNPMGLIPALETPHGPLFETGAILLWLADQHGTLAPAPDSPARGAFLSWLFAVSNGFHADLRQLFYPALYADTDEAAHRAKTRLRLTAHLERFDRLAADGPGWFAGNAPTVLDLYCGALLRWLALYPKGDTDWFALADWPALAALARSLESRPSMQAAQAAEGLGPAPISAPRYATPPEGRAT